MDYIIINATASAAGVTRTQSARIPYEDGEYSLSKYDYPFYRFPNAIISGSTVTIAQETITLGDEPVSIVKHYTAYGYDKVPWDETVVIVISKSQE